eukprot:44939_1
MDITFLQTYIKHEARIISVLFPDRTEDEIETILMTQLQQNCSNCSIAEAYEWLSKAIEQSKAKYKPTMSNGYFPSSQHESLHIASFESLLASIRNDVTNSILNNDNKTHSLQGKLLDLHLNIQFVNQQEVKNQTNHTIHMNKQEVHNLNQYMIIPGKVETDCRLLCLTDYSWIDEYKQTNNVLPKGIAIIATGGKTPQSKRSEANILPARVGSHIKARPHYNRALTEYNCKKCAIEYINDGRTDFETLINYWGRLTNGKFELDPSLKIHLRERHPLRKITDETKEAMEDKRLLKILMDHLEQLNNNNNNNNNNN